MNANPEREAWIHQIRKWHGEQDQTRKIWFRFQKTYFQDLVARSSQCNKCQDKHGTRGKDCAYKCLHSREALCICMGTDVSIARGRFAVQCTELKPMINQLLLTWNEEDARLVQDLPSGTSDLVQRRRRKTHPRSGSTTKKRKTQDSSSEHELSDLMPASHFDAYLEATLLASSEVGHGVKEFYKSMKPHQAAYTLPGRETENGKKIKEYRKRFCLTESGGVPTYHMYPLTLKEVQLLSYIPNVFGEALGDVESQGERAWSWRVGEVVGTAFPTRAFALRELGWIQARLFPTWFQNPSLRESLVRDLRMALSENCLFESCEAGPRLATSCDRALRGVDPCEKKW